jgi:hypothetical protein
MQVNYKCNEFIISNTMHCRKLCMQEAIIISPPLLDKTKKATQAIVPIPNP